MIPVEEHYLLEDATFTILIEETGDYKFYMYNKALDYMYITSFTVEIFHRENWENIQFS